MNKKIFTEELRAIGVEIQSFEFTNQGYVMDLKLDVKKARGWEDLEYLSIPGLEIGQMRTIAPYNKRVIYIPRSRKEFVDYVRKHMKHFGAGKECALEDLDVMIERYGSRGAKIAVMEYLKDATKKLK